MNVSEICVGVVITIIIMILTGGFGFIISEIDEDSDIDWVIYPWILTALGFGVCLTIVLYTYGFIH